MSLTIREMKVKTALTFHLSPARATIIKKLNDKKMHARFLEKRNFYPSLNSVYFFPREVPKGL